MPRAQEPAASLVPPSCAEPRLPRRGTGHEHFTGGRGRRRDGASLGTCWARRPHGLPPDRRPAVPCAASSPHTRHRGGARARGPPEPLRWSAGPPRGVCSAEEHDLPGSRLSSRFWHWLPQDFHQFQVPFSLRTPAWPVDICVAATLGRAPRPARCFPRLLLSPGPSRTGSGLAFAPRWMTKLRGSQNAPLPRTT